ncbi:hypothetical protein TPHA_0A01400 [Tetrapisispora phaffii CBS 4417]|uniref:Transcription initiation factor TFIID subunit 10 n=1 Tax=Tetrapisispora phaffii (strain ATCC 24235 / CBS 4417 / NBRC 1672 / NRRL Y-8282 / UCD 70-5) TaxID=1071381 RepID=G8BMU5_TETPH|nr:hypothetical protein TPHA_0A01400 [Tetrapisispora phaffii CBS 4417]CCE61223.1 hypothetical protein TPHA_0A01400 [Tetrapisispora phaffii CBS 4417]
MSDEYQFDAAASNNIEIANTVTSTNRDDTVNMAEENGDVSMNTVNDLENDVDIDDEFNDNEEGMVGDNNLFGNNDEANNEEKENNFNDNNLFELPEFTRKDKTLNEILDMMDDNPPLIPDAVIEYYMTKNGIECSDLRVKRLLALATQKFISDIASDAYEYSRIRSPVAVNNANNGQARARQLMAAQQLTATQQQQNEKNSQSKVILTVTDLSLAVAEYGLNISRPDFYR